MRVLVTGASGFVGRHLRDALTAAEHEVIAAGGPRDTVPYPILDVADATAIRRLLDEVRPDAVVHLAAQSFVPAALADPLRTIDVNAAGTARVLEAVRGFRDAGGGAVRTLVVSSAEVYGIHRPERMPLDEQTTLRPANPYAASKAAAEAFALAWARSYGLDVVIARPFNHIGPGQDERFAVAAFAHQLAAIAAGGSPVLHVGNLTAERDFLDVRDVCQAYLALLAYGKGGEVYNICSGQAVRIQEVLRQLIAIAHVPVEVREDPERMRPSDLPILIGYASKLRAATGWEPRRTLAETLRDVYADARGRLGRPSS